MRRLFWLVGETREQGHRAPGNLSSGQISARTGRQTPVDGAGRPEEQGTGMAAAAWIMKSYTLQGRRPFRINVIVVPVSPLQVFQGFRVSFYRGNVSFVLVVSFRARLSLFPVPCSLYTSLCVSVNISINQNLPA